MPTCGMDYDESKNCVKNSALQLPVHEFEILLRAARCIHTSPLAEKSSGSPPRSQSRLPRRTTSLAATQTAKHSEHQIFAGRCICYYYRNPPLFLDRRAEAQSRAYELSVNHNFSGKKKLFFLPYLWQRDVDAKGTTSSVENTS